MIKVSYDRAVRKIQALNIVLKRPLRDVLDSGARVAATQMARTAQPFGTGREAQTSGEIAVARDILKVYATPERAYKDMGASGKAGAFWRAYKHGEFQRAESLLRQFGNDLAGVNLQHFDGGAAHRSARNSRGRITQRRPSVVVTDPRALERYISEEKKHVGTGKGGFADIVRAIGGTSGGVRGLRESGDITANWITRRARGYGYASRSGSDENPIITIRNRVPYASNILNGTALSEAKRIAWFRMKKNLEIAVDHVARELRSAA